jgi:hypothetical protein
MSEFRFQTVFAFQFLDTPGDEVAPRSNEIGEDFENEGLSHISSFRRVRVQGVELKPGVPRNIPGNHSQLPWPV